MINLATQPEIVYVDAQATKSRVMFISSLVLVLYLVIMAGMFSWSWYTQVQDKRAAEEVIRLQKELISYAQQEVIINKIASRAAYAQEFIGQRLNFGGIIDTMQTPEVEISDWTYNIGKSNQMTVLIDNPDELKWYIDITQGAFDGMYLQKQFWEKEKGWQAALLLGSFIKK